MLKRICVFFLISTVVLLLFSVSLSRSSEKEGKEPGFVGAETCKNCHEAQYASYAKTLHSKKYVKGEALQDACETCHGPGAKHVKKGGELGADIFAFNKQTDPETKSARCLACHKDTRQMEPWNRSVHKAENVSCDNCHSAHGGQPKLLKAENSEVCFNCHKDIKHQFNKRSRHPVKERLISCFDCHDPHGDSGNRMVKADSINELCYKCHAEKRGPFMWEHPPVQENCLTCHEPHGSSHSRLLVEKVPGLCHCCHDVLDHIAPFTSFNSFGGSATSDKNRFIGRSCLNCHNNIHGSDGPVNPASVGNRFVR